MQLLFLCTTEFQIITAFNIKMNLYSQDEADIIIDNYHGQEKEIAGRIRETKVFRHVCYVRSEIEHETLHKYWLNHFSCGMASSQWRLMSMSFKKKYSSSG